ncbi:hypothetical protein [Chloroflexus sp. Y-396-1]|uniref:hypothetical protein n=1 Tax=Chloroflexus sp. Y-396-1 TaxID=867845 RepID=UPI000490AEFC|nr:hypothetical protein [Chloroflexus sp. Y-396-1]
MRRGIILICLLALVLAPIPVTAQQPSPITIAVQAGIDGEGTYRPGYWFPVWITLANDGADRQVLIEWRGFGDQGSHQHYRIDLPGGARKRIVFPVVHTETRQALLVTTADGVEVERQRVPLNPLRDDLHTLGLLSSDPAVLSSLSTANFAVIPLDPALIADDPLLLAAFDVIAVRDLTTDLRLEQRAALLNWVQQGGTLLVGGGTAGETAIRAFADVLPVTVGPLQRGVSVAALERLSGLNGLTNFVPNLTANMVTLRPNARPVTDDSLVSRREVGAGTIIFAAFDLGALRASPAERNLWTNVLSVQPRIAIGPGLRKVFTNLPWDQLNVPLFQHPSTTTLLLLIGAYIVVIGPIQFLILRRWRRLEWAWISTPLLIVTFLGGTFAMGYLLRGSQVQMVQLSIIQTANGNTSALTTTLVGVFAPQRRSYTFTFAESAFVSAARRFDESTLSTEYSDTGVTIPDLVLDASDFRTLIVEQSTTNPIQLSHRLERDNQGWRGTLTNTGSTDLYDAMLVWQNEMQWIGRLAPGAEVTINLQDGNDNFLRDFMPGVDGTLFYHTGIIENMFWSIFRPNSSDVPFQINGPRFPGDQVYLIGWSNEASPVMQVNSGATALRGETLYIIELR